MHNDYNILRLVALVFLGFLVLSNCNTPKSTLVQQEDNPELPIRTQIKEWSRIKDIQNKVMFRRIDTLLAHLYASPYDDHIYETSNPYYDELRYYYSTNIDYEEYIYEKLIRPHFFPKGTPKKWINTLFLLPKNSCKDGDSRLSRLPWIIRDTSSIVESVNYLTEVAEVLQDQCAYTLNMLQTDVAWRKELYESLIIQLKAIESSEWAYVDEYYEDIYRSMQYLPDSLTSAYAYNYLMQNDTLPEELENLIDKRFRNWSDSYSYTNYSGSRILYSEKEVAEMIKRAEEIQAKGGCNWCETFIRRLKLRFIENW